MRERWRVCGSFNTQDGPETGLVDRTYEHRRGVVTSSVVDGIVIKSSWVAGNGDVIEVGARRPSGRKIKPRKKRGKPISEALRLSQQAKVEAARERRRCGADITRRR